MKNRNRLNLFSRWSLILVGLPGSGDEQAGCPVGRLWCIVLLLVAVLQSAQGVNAQSVGTAKSYQKISETSGCGPNLDVSDAFGFSVDGIGDLDGDGVGDIMVGAPNDDDGAADAGASGKQSKS